MKLLTATFMGQTVIITINFQSIKKDKEAAGKSSLLCLLLELKKQLLASVTFIWLPPVVFRKDFCFVKARLAESK